MTLKNSAPRILIVGDLALSRGLMRMVLTRLDYIVYCVGSAQEAAVAMAHNRFSLALIATRLADGSGLAFSRQLRESGTLQPKLPVILFGDTWDKDQMDRECRNAGIQAFLNKPISISRLVENVRRWTVAANDSFFPDSQDTPQHLRSGDRAMTMTVDIDHLTEFTGNDMQLESELASLYISTAEHYLTKMRGQLDNNEAWERTAHALKGSSANIGAKAMAELALKAEKGEPSGPMLDELRQRLDEVVRYFAERESSHARLQAQRAG